MGKTFISTKLKCLSYYVSSLKLALYLAGDYINSKEYRKPDWLIKMEEIKVKLAGNDEAKALVH